jgi:hypothetical protein
MVMLQVDFMCSITIEFVVIIITPSLFIRTIGLPLDLLEEFSR